MCGIAGIVAREGRSVDVRALRSMTLALRHRGPDGDGVEIHGRVGLGHTRLAVLELSELGSQPMHHPAGRWSVSYNGEIYNHLELRRTLPPHHYRGHCDTETLVHGLHHEGVDFVRRCNGMFAFAALDRADGVLWLVRDRWGIKPLYLAETPDGYLFASEVAALLAGGAAREPDVDALRHALELGWVNGQPTLLRDVVRVEPGTAVAIDLDTLALRERRWFDPAELVDPAMADELERSGDTVELVESALRAAIRARLLADVPVGVMCSGGVDSSVVTALAAEEHPAISAFNASVPDDPAHDERPWAEMAASHIGVELHTVDVTAESWREGFVDTVAHYEYPLTHEASLPLAKIAALARSHGIVVLLSGEGADEVFGGYPWLHRDDWAAFYERRQPLRAARHELKRGLKSLGVLRGRDSEPRSGPCERANRYEDEFLRAAHRAYAHHRGARRRLEGKLLAEMRVYLPQVLARGDKNTMQHSIETRMPFLDPGVVALGLNLPLHERVEPRRKDPLCRISDRLLPREIANRRKVGFNFDVRRFLPPLTSPFLRDGALRDVLEEDARSWDARLSTAAGREPLLLWSAEVWCRLFLAGEAPASVNGAMWDLPAGTMASA